MITPHISFPWKTFLFRVVVPTIVTIILFVSAFFFFIIPAIENASMERKKEMIRELTNSAWNILAKLNNDEKRGLITRLQAQTLAVEQIKNLHYGQSMKDYFWINDMSPKMILHPYRTDLNGKDLSNYTDPDGKKVFMDMVEVVKKHGHGYVNYKWQANDNPSVVIPKISYIKSFEPWGWIIGTGVYLDDVRVEIKTVTESIVAVSLVICMINVLIFGYIIRVSYLTHKKQRAAELELKKTKSSLALSEKMASLGRLSAMVAHEINNPLSGILSYAKLSIRLLEKISNSTDTSSLKENLEIISSETKRCGEIVKNLLLFAKQSMGDIRDVRLNEIITLSTKIIEHSARMKEIELKTEFDSTDDKIQCDPGAIQQILVALIVNSIESSSPGKEIIVKSECKNPNFITIKVIDFGHGISDKDLPFIFDPFFSTKNSNNSLGLGLSAVYGIVQSHSGTIHVESKVGKGTEFSITLPREYTSKKDTEE